jgi:hypothetical protein
MNTIHNLLNFLYLASVTPESILALVNPDTSIEPNNIIILFTSIVPIIIYPNTDLNKEKIILDNKDKAGIYQFINLLTGDSYVGSSINLSKRFRQYFNYYQKVFQKP